jgi:hypothetical protein
MRLRELFSLAETVEDTKEVLRISKSIIDYIYTSGMNKVGAVIEVSDIPQLFAFTNAGKTLITSTRIKIVGPDTWDSPDTRGDAAPYYTNDKGGVQHGVTPYKDARAGRNSGQADLIRTRSEYRGLKLDIRLSANDLKNPQALQSTLTHELSHHLDTIKGRDTVYDQRKYAEAEQAKQKLHWHNQAKRGETVATSLDGKIMIPTRIPELLPPGEVKRLTNLVKKAPKRLPDGGKSMAYWKDPSEINARLMQASEDLADFVPSILYNRQQSGINSQQVDNVIRHMLNTNRITVAFVDFATEEEFFRAMNSGLTEAEQRKAYSNPEFKKIYNRIYKFLEDEMGPGGIIHQASKTGFKNWNQSLPSTTSQVKTQSLRQTFIERFKDVVVKGVAAAKDIAKLGTRFVYRHLSDDALKKLLLQKLPAMVGRGALKALPIAGVVIGVAFAIDRLIKKDVPGAGLELVSGLGSLITAIPTTAYQAARDLYGEYYTNEDTGNPGVLEYDMANDPKGTEQRVKDLSDKIAEELKAGVTKNRNLLRDVDPNLGLI